jgi:serine/threonine-protein kinase RsbT
VSVPVKTDEIYIRIEHDADVVVARRKGKELAAQLGFSGSDLTIIATAISEIARNIFVYAHDGEMTMRPERRGDRQGMEIVARDEGPGIADIELAMQDGYSTEKSLGLGLPGAKRLMDEFEIESTLGVGTTITMRKWRNRR